MTRTVALFLSLMVVFGITMRSWAQDPTVTSDEPVIEVPAGWSIKYDPETIKTVWQQSVDVVGPFEMKKASKWDAATVFISYALPFFQAKEKAIVYSYEFEALEECYEKADRCGLDVERSTLVYSEPTGKFHGYYGKVNFVDEEYTKTILKEILEKQGIALKQLERTIAKERGELVQPMYLATINKLEGIDPEFELVMPSNYLPWPKLDLKAAMK